MAFKKRRMMLVPGVNPDSFVFFFEKGNSGTSWSIRDYSVKNRVKEYGPRDFPLSADDIHRQALHSLDAPTHQTTDLNFWHAHTEECNRQYLGKTPVPQPKSNLPEASPPPARQGLAEGAFPVIDLQELLNSSKGRKPQDMERILHSPNSEDWVTWNFFRLLLKQYPRGWWGHLLSAARRRNRQLHFPYEEGSTPDLGLWRAVGSPPAYEMQNRARMRQSGNPELVLRAGMPDPVEGASEIDIAVEDKNFLVFIEAKLGSDVSLRTSYDPQRNQIVRNIDCLIEKAGGRFPMFWLLAKDQNPSRAYVHLIESYRSDASQLARELPQRDPEILRSIAQNLTILPWSDFIELVCGPGMDQEVNLVKQELERRMVVS